MDPEMLTTLPEKEFINGMAEVIKHGVIRDGAYFRMLDERFDRIMAREPAALQDVIAGSCRIKAAVVAEDEKEANIRRILNFGHTIGHAVEAASKFRILHGFGVGIGMVAAARISLMKGLFDQQTFDAITAMITRYGLPTGVPDQLDRSLIKSYLLADKKRIGSKTSFILAIDIGAVVITEDVSEADIDAVLNL
ncbi:MAG: 3-dehydroquinate synthase [Desulfofustis sp.]